MDSAPLRRSASLRAGLGEKGWQVEAAVMNASRVIEHQESPAEAAPH